MGERNYDRLLSRRICTGFSWANVRISIEFCVIGEFTKESAILRASEASCGPLPFRRVNKY